MFIAVIIWLVVAAVIGSMAGKKGRSGFGWFLIAMLLSPVLALLFLLVAGDAKPITAQATPVPAPAAHPPRHGPQARVIGDDEFRFPIVGESHYQTEIEALAGGRTRSGSTGKRIDVVLQPEPDNPYDPHAVVVKAGSLTIGYLARDVASLFNAALADAGYSSGGCKAAIKGGWDRDGDEGSFGVFLNARLPFTLQRIDSPEARPATSPPEPPSGRAVPVLATIASVLAVCLAAAFLWTRWPHAPVDVETIAPLSVPIAAPAIAIPPPPLPLPKAPKPKLAAKPKPAANAPMNLLPP